MVPGRSALDRLAEPRPIHPPDVGQEPPVRAAIPAEEPLRRHRTKPVTVYGHVSDLFGLVCTVAGS